MTCCDSVSPSRTGKPVSAVTVLGKGKRLPLIAQFSPLTGFVTDSTQFSGSGRATLDFQTRVPARTVGRHGLDVDAEMLCCSRSRVSKALSSPAFGGAIRASICISALARVSALCKVH